MNASLTDYQNLTVEGIQIRQYELNEEEYISVYDLCLALNLPVSEVVTALKADPLFKKDLYGSNIDNMLLKGCKLFIWAISLPYKNEKLEAYRNLIHEELMAAYDERSIIS